MEKQSNQTMGKRILRSMIIIIALVMVVVIVMMTIGMYIIRGTMVENNSNLGKTAGERSSETMKEEITKRMSETANGNADIIDEKFSTFKKSVEMLAENAEYLYNHADDYGSVMVAPPQAKNEGKLSVHMTYNEKTDIDSPKVKKEAGLLGNGRSVLLSAHGMNPSMAACYFATESGLMIEADTKAGDKIGEDGKPIRYDAFSRPWYSETKAEMKTHFTNIVRNATGERVGMMCGSPIMHKKKFMGVACAGMYLDDVDILVQSASLGENGIAFIVNNQGNLLFTSDKSGILTITDENAKDDLRVSTDKSFGKIIATGLNGEEGTEIVTLNGKKYYISYASMRTVGMSFFVMLPEEEIMKPTNSMLAEMDKVTENTEQSSANTIRVILIVLLFISVIAVLMAAFVAIKMSHSIVKPIEKLTKKVQDIEGDDLVFEWDENTQDETQTLAMAFGNMTKRMREYIEQVTAITAEKERIGAELNVATQIQADMLPSIFPPFPEKVDEFDIFASMEPAKEVGGDFYDFFLIDEDHIGMVMADVSGKGVPAALFMVIAKTLIKNRALMGGSPAEVLTYANEQLCEGNEAELFVTVWFGILDIRTGKGLAANAGHEHPTIRRAGGDYELVVYRHSPAVATMEGLKFKEHEFEMAPGDSLFVYTDGVAEATDSKNELYGTDRMMEALNANPEATPKEIIKNVRVDIDKFVGDAPQFDDITMLCFKYLGRDK